MSDTEKRFVLRLSEELYAELESWSTEEMRSVNGQIVKLLREAVQARKAREVKSSEGSEKNRAPRQLAYG